MCRLFIRFDALHANHAITVTTHAGIQIRPTQHPLLRFYAPRGDMLHLWGEIWRGGAIFTPNFTPLTQGWSAGLRDPGSLKVYPFSESKLPTGAYTLRDFYEIYSVCGQFHVRLLIKISGFAQWFGMMAALPRRWVPKISEPTSDEIIIYCEYILEVQKWYGPPLSPS